MTLRGIVKRDAWGAQPLPSMPGRDIRYLTGTLVHHTVGTYGAIARRSKALQRARWRSDHALCAPAMRALERDVIARNYSTIPYNWVACPHGFLFEGRPVSALAAHCDAIAPGDRATANVVRVGVAYLGDGRRLVPRDARDAIAFVAATVAVTYKAQRVHFHGQAKPTECAGGALNEWVVDTYQGGTPDRSSPSAFPERANVPGILGTFDVVRPCLDCESEPAR